MNPNLPFDIDLFKSNLDPSSIQPCHIFPINQPHINYHFPQQILDNWIGSQVNTTLQTDGKYILQNPILVTVQSSDVVGGYNVAFNQPLYNQQYFPRTDNYTINSIGDQYENTVNAQFRNMFDYNTNPGLLANQTVEVDPIRLSQQVSAPHINSLQEPQLQIQHNPQISELPQPRNQNESVSYQRENQCLPSLNETIPQTKKKHKVIHKSKKKKAILTDEERRKKNSQAAKRSREKRKQRGTLLRQHIAETKTHNEELVKKIIKLNKEISIYKNAIDELENKYFSK